MMKLFNQIKSSFNRWLIIATVEMMLVNTSISADKAAPIQALGKIPVKEITVFKDGHAFINQEAEMPVDAQGNVILDALPSPVIGTFWPYSADPRAKLTGVVASQRRVLVERSALTLREWLEANVGAEGYFTENYSNHYSGAIVGIPTRTAEELAATNPADTGEKLPEKGNLIVLKTAEGIKVLSLDRLQDVTFTRGHKTSVANEEFRNLLTLKLDWGAQAPARTAKVGLMYVQKGARWIPSYKVTIDGHGSATIKLEATLLNELTDLTDATLNLVIGVPSFAFKDTLDPMALQQTLAQLSQYFQADQRTDLRNSALAQNFSNAIMTQAARMSDYRPAESSAGAGAEFSESMKNEDLFVFTLNHITIRKGERMVLPITEFTLSYKDIYTLDLPFAPPPEVRANLNTSQQQELARLFNAPKVQHKIRLQNQSQFPLTTAPALILREGRILAQGMMTYTAPGASSDLALTTAVDIQVKKTDQETKRTPNAVVHNGSQYTRVDLAGSIRLTNHRPETVDLEVTRFVLGNTDTADHQAQVEKINVFENGESWQAGDYPYWWNWYGWPTWWSYFNGVGRVTWKTSLAAGKDLNLGYTWYYYWR